MKYCRIIQKLSVLFLLCLVSIAVQGQTNTAGPFYHRGQQFSMDLRHINWADFEGIRPSRALSRGNVSTTRWIDRIDNMPSYLKDFYQVYAEKVSEVMNGGANWLSDPTKGEYSSYTEGDYESQTYSVTIKNVESTADFVFPVGSSQDVIAQKAAETMNVVYDNVVNEFDCFIRYLILCLNYDFPEAFWTGNSAYWGFGWSYYYNWNSVAGTGTVHYTIPLSFTLRSYQRQLSTNQEQVDDYRIAGFQTQQQVSDGVTEFKAKVQAVTDLFKGKSRYEQVKGLDDWLTKHNSYNSSLQSGVPDYQIDPIAWSSMSALRENTGEVGPVCEGYARAFKCLCDKLGIPSILAVGNAKGSPYDAGEAHMWNEVQMENGKWYAVDVTWDDPIVWGPTNNEKVSGAENQFWLLLGKNDDVGGGFTFAESHPNQPASQNEAYQSQWSFLFTSLIADTRYQPSSEPAVETTVPIEIGASGKTTYCGSKSLDFSYSEDIKAYTATGYDAGAGIIWLTRVKDVPAGTPVLVKGTASTTFNVPITNSQNSYYENMFVGNVSGASIQVGETEGNYVNYYLSGKDGTFKSVNKSVNIGNNKAYLQLPGSFEPAASGDAQSVTIGSAGKVSYAAPVDLDFSNVAGLKAFTATGYDKSGTIWLTRVMKVQKGEGLLLKGDANQPYTIPSAAVQSAYKNMFVGNISGATISVGEKSSDGFWTHYYLSGKDGTFKSVNKSVNIAHTKSYLQLPTDMVNTAAAATRGIGDLFNMDEPEVIAIPVVIRRLDSATGIDVQSSIFRSASPLGSSKNVQSKDAYYNLQGQRVDKPGKGLYIKNGRMVIIR